MTYVTFQPSQTSKKTSIAGTATSARLAVSFFRNLFSGLPTKRPVDADSILAAQARRETARRNADNLLR